uniref:Uncharacterized protein MANES_18G032800 n=1 Tax=Rhizophora mucronata TaxID=61149 RepID=A0A2P2IXJ6_RHIMU
MVLLRSIYRRATCFRSACFAAATTASATAQQQLLCHNLASRSLFSLSSSTSAAPPTTRLPSHFGSPFALGIGKKRSFSEDVTHLPVIQDPEILNAFKDLMAESWDELPDSVVYDVKQALSKNTDDKAGQEILANVFRAAEAAEEFGGILISLKMDLDDSIGYMGEDVKPLSEKYSDALRTVFQRYTAYLEAFGPDENYLRKKVETELGSKMIYLKMRCGGLAAEWWKVTVLGTSGLAGSYVEQRA